MTGRRLLAGIALIALLGAGCGVRPSGVITGGPAPTKLLADGPGPPPISGAALYFLAGSSLTQVLRATSRRLSPGETLALLQDGPDRDERGADLTTEVPTGLDPVTVTTDGSGRVDVVVSADVTTLSATAVDQIVCTVRDALAGTAPITVRSAAASTGPRTCPLTG